MATDVSVIYSVEWVSTFFHGFPHLDFNFNEINSTFQPTDDSYRQSVIFWSLIPVAACCFFWLLFLLCCIVRCCCGRERVKRRPSPCSRITTGLLLFFGAGLIGFGLYENEVVHHGIDNARQAAIDASNTVANALGKITLLENIANDVQNVSHDLEKAISEIPDKTVAEYGIKLIEDIRNYSSVAQDICRTINMDDHQKEIQNATDLTDQIEYYRWVITIVIYSMYILICFLMTLGLLLKSRTMLILSAVVAVLCSVLLWLSAGVYLGSSVGLGDFCVDPDTFSINLVDLSHQKIASDYIKCLDTSQPYQEQIVSAQAKISKAVVALEEVQSLVKPYNITNLNNPMSEMVLDLNNAMGNLSTLLSTVGMCTGLHQFYVAGLEAVCVDTINSAALLTLVFCILGLIFTIVILTVSCIWRGYAHRRRADYNSTDDTDPFLPRPPPYDSDYGAVGHSSPRPWSERGSLQHTSSASNFDYQFLMTTHPHTFPDETPPPAYYPGVYGRRTTDVRATTSY
ncbi:hypothetical protein Btru_073349 [Bulinus truncatus]|nr:hypothetical protein Btru_073349 [Bulinus truncatus]